jgi:TDG/mug DNA glycosylase family protein
MDRVTVDVYEPNATHCAEQRRVSQLERARAFARSLAPGSLRLDLGSGPGLDVPDLGTPVVAADAARVMVADAHRRRGPDDHPLVSVVCDLEALPFRPGAFAGLWARACLQHIPPERLPMALAGLHRSMAVGGVLGISVVAGREVDTSDLYDTSEISGADDDIPGRLFTRWGPETLRRVLVGAGFDVDTFDVQPGPRSSPRSRGGADGPPAGPPPRTESTPGSQPRGEASEQHGTAHLRPPAPSSDVLSVSARRSRTLADTVGPDMRLLVCGLNPSLYAADAGVAFARPGNRFWPAARAASLVTADRDPDHALRRHGIGLTDLVKRATVTASELTAAEYRSGLERVEHLIRWLRPATVCFVGLAGWRAAVDRAAQAGIQPGGLGGVPVYVMPSTSGLNARSSLEDLTGHLRAAARLADAT